MESNFQVILLPEAQKNLKQLPWKIEFEILEALQSLKKFPFAEGKTIKKIRTLSSPHYELKIKDYRAIFRIENREIIIKLIIHRKDLEKELKNLNR